MRVVVALGGNALLRRGEPPEADLQRANVRDAAAALARLAPGNELVVTHGNGPQVGLLALQAEAYADVRPYPLDILDAETEGMLGYLIEQELSNRLPGREIAALLTRVEVDSADPAFERPTKPVGPVYDEEQARRMTERGWSMAPDGPGFRRVVPSPAPKRIIEHRTIELLLEAGHIVVCAGGGGIPVARTTSGTMRGVEAVIDKDRTAALLACRSNADRLVLLTDVAAVWTDWPAPAKQAIRTASPASLRDLPLDAGSMGPKVEAAIDFVTTTGKSALIGALADAANVFEGRSGTTIEPGTAPIRYYDAEALASLRRASQSV